MTTAATTLKRRRAPSRCRPASGSRSAWQKWLNKVYARAKQWGWTTREMRNIHRRDLREAYNDGENPNDTFDQGYVGL